MGPSDPLSGYLQEARSTPLLTADQERDLATRARAGDAEARAQLVEANLLLAAKWAMKAWYGRPKAEGMDLADFIQHANLGLLAAVEKFDPGRGARFSTYATYYIRQRIGRGVTNEGLTVRLPAHVVDQLARIRRAENALTQHLDRPATDAEVATKVDAPEEVVTLQRATKHRSRIVSLDAPIVEDDDTRTLHNIVAGDAQDPGELVEVQERQDLALRAVSEALTERERQVIIGRFGLGDEEQSLEEIGRRFGVTRERVRQIEQRALAKLARWIKFRRKPRLTAPPPSMTSQPGSVPLAQAQAATAPATNGVGHTPANGRRRRRRSGRPARSRPPRTQKPSRTCSRCGERLFSGRSQCTWCRVERLADQIDDVQLAREIVSEAIGHPRQVR